jgi:hypothetical protein
VVSQHLELKISAQRLKLLYLDNHLLILLAALIRNLQQADLTLVLQDLILNSQLKQILSQNSLNLKNLQPQYLGRHNKILTFYKDRLSKNLALNRLSNLDKISSNQHSCQTNYLNQCLAAYFQVINSLDQIITFLSLLAFLDYKQQNLTKLMRWKKSKVKKLNKLQRNDS